MKKKFPIAVPCDGKVLQVFCQEGSQVSAGQDLIVLEAA
ncbi:MAG: biotin/lipoyl-binding protein [Betaproteobacteria bacterium]|nr:biotin/lipoyl-binding protein [Betaproteobacteria bacterium]